MVIYSNWNIISEDVDQWLSLARDNKHQIKKFMEELFQCFPDLSLDALEEVKVMGWDINELGNYTHDVVSIFHMNKSTPLAAIALQYGVFIPPPPGTVYPLGNEKYEPRYGIFDILLKAGAISNTLIRCVEYYESTEYYMTPLECLFAGNTGLFGIPRTFSPVPYLKEFMENGVEMIVDFNNIEKNISFLLLEEMMMEGEDMTSAKDYVRDMSGRVFWSVPEPDRDLYQTVSVEDYNGKDHDVNTILKRIKMINKRVPKYVSVRGHFPIHFEREWGVSSIPNEEKEDTFMMNRFELTRLIEREQRSVDKDLDEEDLRDIIDENSWSGIMEVTHAKYFDLFDKTDKGTFRFIPDEVQIMRVNSRGMKHCLDSWAFRSFSGSEPSFYEWRTNGVLHRLDGPAVIKDGSVNSLVFEEWWEYGKKIKSGYRTSN
jgi:hypothetical protein